MNLFRYFLITAHSIFFFLAHTSQAQEAGNVASVTNLGGGRIDVVCTSGRKASAALQGTIIMVDITEPDGSKSGMSLNPSGGSTDPNVAVGDGRSLAKEICS